MGAEMANACLFPSSCSRRSRPMDGTGWTQSVASHGPEQVSDIQDCTNTSLNARVRQCRTSGNSQTVFLFQVPGFAHAMWSTKKICW